MSIFYGFFNTGDIVNVTYHTGKTNTMRVLSRSTYAFTEIKQCTVKTEKNAKLNKAKAQYQKLNDWRNRRKR